MYLPLIQMNVTLMPTVPLNARIDKSVKDDLLEVCKITSRSQSYHTQQALAEYVAREKDFIVRVQAGKEAIDRGEFVEHSRVMKWLDSWGADNKLPMPHPTQE
jgi:predicted transcriptional regulator